MPIYKEWTEKEEEFLRNNYKSHSLKQLAELLGRTQTSILHKAQRLGLRKKAPKSFYSKREWTDDEIRLLKKMHKENFTNVEIAKKLGRTKGSVGCKAIRLGLRREPEYITKARMNAFRKNPRYLETMWKKSDDEKLAELFERGDNIEEIGKILGRTYWGVVNRIRLLGLKREKKRNVTVSWLKGEKLAEEFFKRRKWRIVEKANRQAAHDFIVEIDKVYAINVKHGYVMHEPFNNFRRLIKSKFTPALLYVTPDEKFYFMPIIDMEMPLKAKHRCFSCLEWFEPEKGDLCEDCGWIVCPTCQKCFCNLNDSAKTAIRALHDTWCLNCRYG